MKIECPKACGECCKVVILTNNHRIKMQKQWANEISKYNKFYLKHFKQITLKEAIKIRPSLINWDHWKTATFFICDLFDYEKNKCKGYNRWRPTMCVDFPFYEKAVLDAQFLSSMPNCYYINQLMKV